MRVGLHELNRVEELLTVVNFDTFELDWKLIYELDDQDIIGIYTNDGTSLVGVVSAVAYSHSPTECSLRDGVINPFGWIGNLVVHPDFRRRGLANLLATSALEHLEIKRRCERVLLDASPMGKHVYDQIGFHDAGFVHVMQLAPSERANFGDPSAEQMATSSMVRIMDDAAMQQVCRLDAEIFGASRHVVLRKWRQLWPHGAVWVPGPDGKPLVYGFTHRRRECNYIGPISVAPCTSAHTAEAVCEVLSHIIRECTTAGAGAIQPIVCQVLEPSPDHPSLKMTSHKINWRKRLETLGFECTESNVRQVYSNHSHLAPGVPSCMVAIASLDLG
ncbi:hypothetical protein CYMTET_4331 [Cymbomonas tetramitiformis]|uniref:N-acetyltransferase domain-containing protein n=1 Tax=Cymbomonas tetramitiformis TaxID=36881 RepID=A0AAE0LJZ7_9CHLO|nr:hypothetical protein CYMTET_4331 [Cymbomonas tetramitiformis]